MKNWCLSTAKDWRKSNEEKIGLTAFLDTWNDAMTSLDPRAKANGDPRPGKRVQLYKDIVTQAEKYMNEIASDGNGELYWDWENDFVGTCAKYGLKHSGLLILFSFRTTMRSCRRLYSLFKNL